MYSRFQKATFVVAIFLATLFTIRYVLPTFAEPAPTKTPKFGIFYPPTITNTPTPTSTPTPTPTPSLFPISPSITPKIDKPTTPTPTLEPIITSISGETCFSNGLGLYNPQVSRLRTYLCSDGSIAPPYEPSFIPINLVNLANTLGSQYWVRQTDMLIRKEVVATLKRFLDYLRSMGCTPMVAYAYRSWQLQQYLYYSRNCEINSACGVAPPGRSTHQAGVAIDLFCAKLETSGNVSISRLPQEAIDNSLFNNLIHPIPWDTPHFIGL